MACSTRHAFGLFWVLSLFKLWLTQVSPALQLPTARPQTKHESTPGSSPEPSSGDDSSTSQTSRRSGKAKSKKTKSPSPDKVARKRGHCKHCHHPMRGHKKTNCMSLPNANFLPKSERTPTPPLPAPPPPVEQAHTVTPITSYSFANTTMAPSAFDMSQGSDYTYNQSYMPNAFQASYASSSSSAVAPFDPAATFYPHVQVPMAPNMGGMAMLGDNGAFPGLYYGLQSHMHEQSGMSTSAGYPPHEPHHQESFGILPDTPYLADDAAPNPYNYNDSPLTNPHMLSYDSGFFQ